MGRIAFTCLLPVYGGDNAQYFELAAASLSASTVSPDAVVICIDGDLPDRLATAVERWAERLRAQVVHNPGPRGLQHNLNHGLARVQTPWVARCDADDVNLPDRFAIQTDFLVNHPEVGVLGGNLIEFWPDGREQSKRMPLSHEEILAWAQWRSPVNHNTVYYRTADVLAVGGYPDIRLREDYALWLKLLAQGVRFANVRADLVRARLGEGFYERRSGLHTLRSEWELYRIRAGEENLGGPTALAALIARSAALTLSGPARLVYEWGLRR